MTWENGKVIRTGQVFGRSREGERLLKVSRLWAIPVLILDLVSSGFRISSSLFSLAEVGSWQTKGEPEVGPLENEMSVFGPAEPWEEGWSWDCSPPAGFISLSVDGGWWKKDSV